MFQIQDCVQQHITHTPYIMLNAENFDGLSFLENLACCLHNPNIKICTREPECICKSIEECDCDQDEFSNITKINLIPTAGVYSTLVLELAQHLEQIKTKDMTIRLFELDDKSNMETVKMDFDRFNDKIIVHSDEEQKVVFHLNGESPVYRNKTISCRINYMDFEIIDKNADIKKTNSTLLF